MNLIAIQRISMKGNTFDEHSSLGNASYRTWFLQLNYTVNQMSLRNSQDEMPRIRKLKGCGNRDNVAETQRLTSS